MSRITWILISILLFFNCGVLYAQDHEFLINHGGLERKYIVHIPTGYKGTVETPVVIYLHGGGGSVKAAYKDGLDKASDKFGFILVIPAGTGFIPDRLLTWNGGKWSGGDCCGYAVRKNIDDVGFISKIIDEIKKKFRVDENRIYATGISNGAIMAYRLACELSDKIAAVAAVAPPAILFSCAPSMPVSIMHIQGELDTLVPINGGIGASERFEAQSARQMVDSWIKMNNCAADFTTTYKQGSADCISYGPCKNGAEVEFCTIGNMGHAWPSGAQYLPAKKIGPVSYDLSFEQIWEFFKRHQK